jgi:hypothetical protein
MCILIGEWRGAKPDKVNYTDKKTGAAKSFGKVTHVVEVGANKTFESVTVTEMLPDNVDPEKYVAPFKRGDRVMVNVKTVALDFGKRDVGAYVLAKV